MTQKTRKQNLTRFGQMFKAYGFDHYTKFNYWFAYFALITLLQALVS